MKQAVIVVGLVLLLSFIISGGFSVKNSEEPLPSQAPIIGDLSGEGDQTANDRVLQLRNLKFTARTPVPPSSAQPSSQPSASPNCQNENVAIDLLLDTSGSMLDDDKLGKLKTAVVQFAENLQPEDIIGVQQFSSSNVLGGNGASIVFQFGQYDPLIFNQRINSLNTNNTALTFMRSGFELAQQVIAQARLNPDYSKYNWFLIFLSDGLPNDSGGLSSGPDESQNPSPIADQIKAEGITIISIGLDLDAFARAGAQYLTDYARDLMRYVASDPDNVYYKESPSGDDLRAVYNQIARSICR